MLWHVMPRVWCSSLDLSSSGVNGTSVTFLQPLTRLQYVASQRRPVLCCWECVSSVQMARMFVRVCVCICVCICVGVDSWYGVDRRLSLPSNAFTTSDWTVVTALSNLAYLDLHGNQLWGTVPSTLSQLSSLTYLDLSVNLMSGSVPATLTALSKLRFVL